MNENNYPKWMNDELVKDIPREKLHFLGSLFTESQGKNQKELMSQIMLAMKKAKQENLTFSVTEMNSAIAAIKKYSSTDELEKINNILNKAKNGGK